VRRWIDQTNTKGKERGPIASVGAGEYYWSCECKERQAGRSCQKLVLPWKIGGALGNAVFFRWVTKGAEGGKLGEDGCRQGLKKLRTFTIVYLGSSKGKGSWDLTSLFGHGSVMPGERRGCSEPERKRMHWAWPFFTNHKPLKELSPLLSETGGCRVKKKFRTYSS